MRRHHVEDDEGREPKRTRTSRACDQCRSRKYRCDGRQPKCFSCTKLNRECTYNPSRKRGLPTGYVKVLEMLLGLLLRAFDNNGRILLPILQHCLREPSLNLKEGDVASNNVLETWRKSEVFKLVEELLSLMQSTDEEECTVLTLDEALTAALSIYRNGNNAAAETLLQFSNQENLQLSNPTGVPIGILSPPVSAGFTPCVVMPSSGPLRLPPNWLELLEEYIATTHCWFPISQKHELLRIAYTIANTTAEPNDELASGDLAFLWAVFAYTTRQSEGEGILGDAADYERVAFNFIGSGSLQYSLGHVRALLILTLLHTSLGIWTRAWVLIGQALYLASDLGIIPQYKNNDNTFSMELDDGQKRVFLGCFILDTLISTHLKRRSFLNSSDLQHVGSINTEGFEEWEPWKPQNAPDIRPFPGKVLSTFNGFIETIGLLNDFNNTANAGLSENRTEATSQKLSLFEERLNQQILQNLNCDNDSYQPPHFLNLQFAIAGIKLAINQRTSATEGEPLNSYLVASLRLLKKHSQATGLPWHSPLLKIYSALFDQQLNTEEHVLSNTVFTGLTPHSAAVEFTETPLDHDEDALFDSLAILDSVGPLEGPRFLEHLGMAPNENPIDFSTLFGRNGFQ